MQCVCNSYSPLKGGNIPPNRGYLLYTPNTAEPLPDIEA